MQICIKIIRKQFKKWYHLPQCHLFWVNQSSNILQTGCMMLSVHAIKGHASSRDLLYREFFSDNQNLLIVGKIVSVEKITTGSLPFEWNLVSTPSMVGAFDSMATGYYNNSIWFLGGSQDMWLDSCAQIHPNYCWELSSYDTL